GPIWPKNPIKYAIRQAISAGVPANTIVLLLLLPLVASIVAAARHLVGLRGFGIFLPAALSVVFIATRPVVGIGLFLAIVTVATLTRMVIRKLKIKLQYLPRMALILWVVSFSVLVILFATPLIRHPDLTNVSIFPILIMALLAEDFIRVQLGKSIRTAINLTTETLILALVSYFFLTLKAVQEFALLNPEWYLLGILIFDYILGKYVGLRLMELWRFRRLVRS
ncbi:MAG: 7TM domain-containing protein, partial [Patescibacteria group bacterium]